MGDMHSAGRRIRVAVVVARFNDFVTERLLTGAQQALRDAGVAERDVAVVRVPGAYEIPMAAQRAAETDRFDAVVCLGCLIRGATPHFEYIASSVAHGLQTVASHTGVPLSFGVLTTNSAEEALERSVDGPTNKGYEAAMAALDMAAVYRSLSDGEPT